VPVLPPLLLGEDGVEPSNRTSLAHVCSATGTLKPTCTIFSKYSRPERFPGLPPRSDPSFEQFALG
jgi:hypothetical protein